MALNPQLLPEINIINTRNNMEGNGKVDIIASPSAVTTSQNASGPITSMDNAGPDATLKAVRRIHFLTSNRYSEIPSLKKVIAMLLQDKIICAGRCRCPSTVF
jgi:hypothetical protein